MSHHDEHDGNLTVAAFFEEYGMIVFFGGFFAMNMLLPTLFLPPECKEWYSYLITFVLTGIVLLVIMMILNGRKKA